MKKHYQSVFISDIHLGTKQCKDKLLLEFLKSFHTENLFLVGDIVDGWSLKKRHYWSKTQTEIVRRILKISEQSTVFYIPGNHDEFIRPFLHFDIDYMGSIRIRDEIEYRTLAGTRLLIRHGDNFDLTMKIPSFLHGSLDQIVVKFPYEWTHSIAYKINKFLSTERRARKFIRNNDNIDTIVMGHTHVPKIDGEYINTGDWVHSCSYVTEDLKTGELKLEYYNEK